LGKSTSANDTVDDEHQQDAFNYSFHFFILI
jgi:hypothetical protein